MLRDLHDDLAEFLRILPNLGELARFLQHLDKVSLLSVVFFPNVSRNVAGTAGNPRSLPDVGVFCSKIQERLRKSAEIL